jgi:hypothetical protein
MKRKLYLSIVLIAFMCVPGMNVIAQTYTITFPSAPPPTNDPSVDQNDHLNPPNIPEDAIETGVRFYVTQPGTVTGIRFYKGNLVTGTHIGHLWTNTGTQLAQATFSETANGWQEVAISVHINAGTNYVASVFNNIGDYAGQNNAWVDQGGADYGTAPIKVVAYSNDPAHNGVYKYLFNATNPNGAFPDQDGGASNYWIDIRFQPDFSLPVSLSEFKATVNTSDVVLSWKTDFENNNRGFDIQRSNDGINWYNVGNLNGAGQSTTVKTYSFTDHQLAPGKYFYRLRQNDFDGKSTYSGVVTALINGKGVVSLYQNYPNPFNTTSTIRFDLPSTQKIRLSVIDLAGREVQVLVNELGQAGTHQAVINAAALQRQVYLVRLQTESGVLTKAILVQ